ncbi:MAG: TonB-dependent receptor [Verrucomicrobia bacterium]|nr:TonB-dependent receptor [Verrucomicrobiota bacterium]
MQTYSPRCSPVWLGGLLLALPVLVFSQAAPTTGGPTPGRDEAVKLEAFTVTGSNIKRLDFEKVLPITSFNMEQIEIRAAAQPAELLTALPEVTGLPGNETATLGATARGDNSSVSLRGIPSGNTLILLNGRRIVPHPISQGEAGVPALTPNINQLPNRGLERVEVLRDGASSIYGSDAVAGVVNYIMKKDRRGTELSVTLSETGYHDGQDYRATLTHGLGFAKGRGRAVLVADFYHRNPIFVRSRPFAADADTTNRAPAPWNNPLVDTSFFGRSATSAYGGYITGTITGTDAYGAVSTFAGARPAGVPTTMVAASGTFFLAPGPNNSVVFATATPSRAGATREYWWNNNPYRVIQPKSARTNVYASVEYDLNDRVTAFLDASMYRAESVTYREPDGITQSTDGYIIVPATNPWNPFGTRFWSPTGAPNTDGTPRLTGTPSAVSITNKRLLDLPDRTDWVDNSVYRGVVGLRGKLFRTWTWEGAFLYSGARVIENEEGPSRKSLLIAAINQTDSTRAFNPFTRTFAVQNGQLVVTGDYRNPASVTSTFTSSFIRSGITKLGSGDFRASGDVYPIWGGNTIGGAFGGEFRYETYDDYRPPYAGLNPPGSGMDLQANDFLGFSPNSDTHGNRHVAAAYAEVVVPVFGRKFTAPLVQSLEISASLRHESYTDFGETTKPKYGVNWKPVAGIMVRSSYNEGFRAPNLAQLFTGQYVRTATGVTDSYRSAVTGLPTDGSSNRRTINSGNPNLRPEQSTGRSGGVVIEVPWVKGLSLSADYWEIRQRDVITAPTSGELVNDDRDALLAATQAALAAGQRLDQIDLGSGTSSYKGTTQVLRLPVTQADRDFFAAYNATRTPANQRAVVGAISLIFPSTFNKAQQFLNGFDYNLTYRLPKLPIGSISFETTWSRLNAFFAYNSAGAPRTLLRETNLSQVGGATPVWRGASTVSWRRKQWGAGVGFYYIGRYTDTGATTTKATWDSLGNPSYIQEVYNNGSYVYRYVVHDSKSYNVNASYRFGEQAGWLKSTDIRVSVNNVLNAKPPLSSDTRGYDVGLYNTMARGRIYSLQITRRF